MKILFISMVPFESNTSATIQNKGIVKGLTELGHIVDTLTLKLPSNAIRYDESMNDIMTIVRNCYYIEPSPLYVKLMAKKSYNTKVLSNNKDSTHFETKSRSKIRSIIKKIYNNISIYDAQKLNVKQVLKLKINYNLYDIIISASDPKSSHLIAKMILKHHPKIQAKWIQYWGDPMLHDITRKSNWCDGLVKYNERKLISEADRVIYASPLTLKVQMQTYPRYSYKMDYANQAYANVSNKTAVKENGSNIVIGYFGAYNSKVRNIIPLYNVAKHGKFILNVCGSSDVSLESTDNILIHGPVSYKESVKMEQEADILVCICNSRGTQIPGKIYYYTAYQKPIIVILDGEYKNELREYFESFNRFILCENNEISIKEAIEKAEKQLKGNNFKIPREFTPEYIARKILGKFQEIEED